MHALDDFLGRHALANEGRLGRTYVLLNPSRPELPALIGYYCLSMAQEAPARLAGVEPEKLPRYELPVALVGRLAVDERARRRRFGGILLLDALQRIVLAANIIGCLGVVVDAKDEAARSFYARHGFVELPGQLRTQRMYLPMAAVRAAVAPK